MILNKIFYWMMILITATLISLVIAVSLYANRNIVFVKCETGKNIYIKGYEHHRCDKEKLIYCDDQPEKCPEITK